jgi:hypothetical protein
MSSEASSLDGLFPQPRRSVQAWFFAGLLLAAWLLGVVAIIAAVINGLAAGNGSLFVLIPSGLIFTFAVWRKIIQRLRRPPIIVPREMRCLLREDRRRQQWLAAHARPSRAKPIAI